MGDVRIDQNSAIASITNSIYEHERQYVCFYETLAFITRTRKAHDSVCRFVYKAPNSWSDTSLSSLEGSRLTFEPYEKRNMLTFRKISVWFSNDHSVWVNNYRGSFHAKRKSKRFQCDTSVYNRSSRYFAAM